MSRTIQPTDLLALKTVSDVQLSPDGSRIAYALTHIEAEADEYRSSIWLVPAAGGEPPQFTRGPKSDSAPRWSPDGQWLAFLSDRASKEPQLYLLPTAGGEPRQLTTLDLGAGPAVWSPDSSRIVFSARVSKDEAPGDEKTRERWQQRPKVVTRAHYKDDGQGYTFDANRHLFSISLDGGQVQQLTHGEGDYNSASWTPDGRRFAFRRTRAGQADYALGDIWTADADGSHARRISDRIGRATSPTWSPDGSRIACYGNEQQVPGLGDPIQHVWVMDADGAQARALTLEYDRGVVLLPPPAVTPGPFWSKDGRSLTFAVAERGDVHIVRAPLDGTGVQTVVGGERQVTAFSVSTAGARIAFVASQFDNPSDIYVCDWNGADEQCLTHVNAEWLEALELPRIERRTFETPNGAIDGWLVRARGDGHAPLLVDVHGGPHGFHGNAFALGYFYRYVLAGRGWNIIALNPTGSGSYGKVFAHDLRGRWGVHELPEQLAAVDALIAEGLADPERLAVAGYSYGGFMTSYTITHCERYKAAVVGAPVTNLESFHGTSDIGMWFGPWEMQGDLATSRDVFRRLSPIHGVENVTTPTLILHGEADDRCPIGQGEEFFVGLVAAGKVPTQFVRYPGGSHLFIINGRPSHRVDFVQRVVDWVECYTT